jgi:NAD(P)-dependent dehydrogenase (short-subunit alcohol dehydrogenase family)
MRASSFDFTGTVVIVTGGTAGIGRVIAERYLAAGADVAVCGRNEPESLPSGGGREAVFVPCDVRDPDQVDLLVTTVEERFGRVDVVVNNAGGSPHVLAADASPRFSEAIVKLNLLAPLFLATRANQTMQEQENGGVVINITSVSGTRPSPGASAYGAAKAGVMSLTETLAVEWAPRVRVVWVLCGVIETEKAELHYGDAAGVAAVASTVPMDRMGTPDDVADACLFLASDQASFVTGAGITLHGGNEKTPAYLAAAEASAARHD